MAQSGYTPILIYASSTPGALPSAANLTSSASGAELAINYADGKLYFKNSSGVVTLLAGSSSGPAGGSNTQVQYNSSGVLAGSANMTFNGTKLTVAGFLDSALTSGRVPYATTSGELIDSANLLYSGTDLTVYGVTVGRGAGSVSTNTAVGVGGPLAANTTGINNTAHGNAALGTNKTGSENTAIGSAALIVNDSGSNNTAVGRSALALNNASNNTAVGYQAGYSNTTGGYNAILGYQTGYNVNTNYNTFIGYQAGYGSGGLMTGARNTGVGVFAGYSLTSGNYNAFFGSLTAGGASAGSSITTGSSNVILGNYTGNNGGLDIRTANNYIVLSDGDGNPRMYYGSGQWNITPVSSSIGWSTSTSAGDSMANIQFPTRGDGTTNTSQSGSSVIQYFNDGNGAAPASINFVRTTGTGGGISSGSAITFNATRNTYPPYGLYSNAEVARATGAGVISFANSGFDTAGIQFPASQLASFNANTLDDYEEGTATVSLSPETSGTITINTTYDTVAYTKIGRQVTITGQVQISSVSNPVGAYVHVNNLPFASAALSELSGRIGGAVTYYDDSAGTFTAKGVMMLEGGTQARLYVDASTVAATDSFLFSFSYFTT